MAQTMAEYLIEQGAERGEAQAKREAVLKLLQFRFDTVPESVSRRISTMRSLSHLDSLFEEGFGCPNA